MKPPYRVPSMTEINAVPKEFSAASTFSGCGGSSLGYRMAGFGIRYANEFIPAARETYAANASKATIVDGRDIRTVTAEEILAQIKMKPGELDLFDGSPPCATFSTAGKREAGWSVVKKYSDTKQRVDDLFFEYLRLLAGLLPKTFVAENVAGLVRGVAVGYFNDVMEMSRSLGYRVGAKVLDAQWLGLPQQRTRIIIVGVREDVGLPPAFPKPFEYRYSLGDACPWMKPPGDLLAPDICPPGWNDGPDITKYAIGGEWDKLAEGEQSSRYFNLIRSHRDKPCPTILASHGASGIAGVTHPVEKRKFSLVELRRICGFPDDFVLTGTFEQGWERLGRAVPPLMMKAIAGSIRDEVLIPYREARKKRELV